MKVLKKKDIELDAKWLLKQIRLMMQGIKEEKHSNPYDSMYKLIRQLFNYWQAEDESCNKFLKRFLNLSLSLKISGIDVTTNRHLIDTDNKNMTTADPNKNTILANKEATSSASEDLAAMVF